LAFAFTLCAFIILTNLLLQRCLIKFAVETRTRRNVSLIVCVEVDKQLLRDIDVSTVCQSLTLIIHSNHTSSFEAFDDVRLSVK